ncbi:hypothetical protein RN001_001488 [Aquatica leii]|uniref:PBZ-type domain-containing protein n=1 Tax=Aquatica leii TaxID=1421715 RepID=A0AAN7Q7W4_9COLE|nr:hypothetical protein RN001_001488 [Aquatica leii]
MITVFIYKLDAETAPIANLKKGTHTFGRGALLECDDRRVSRIHGVIEISNNSVTIASTHQNPCFYQRADNKTITILPKNTPVNLNDGDKFALLADQFWFKVKIEKDDLESNNNDDEVIEAHNNSSTSNNEEAQASKRNYEDNNDDNVPAKKTKLNNIPGISLEEKVSKDESKREIRITQQPNFQLSTRDAELKAMLFSSDDDEVLSDSTPQNLHNVDNNCGINSEDKDATANDNKASTSKNEKVRRDYCMYGAECYRKNNEHFAEYSHPGDSDYESDPNDDRPICSYGASCYRSNKDHRKSYKHPRGDQNTKKLVKKPRPVKKTTPKKRTNRKNYIQESSEDDYDLDDPFMADSSSEFEIDSVSEDDTNSNSSSGPEEEETKRLVKEAKRFTKGKKKDNDFS